MFTATMSRNRFTSILKFLSFDNCATRQERQADDKLAPFRDLESIPSATSKVLHSWSRFLR